MNTDTCPDCSNIPCDCGLPAAYAPTPRTDDGGRYCSHQRRERWIKQTTNTMNDRHTREADMKTNIVRLLAENAELKSERDEAREQRDRLAEALRNCMPFISSEGMGEYHDAREALADVKGGSDES